MIQKMLVASWIILTIKWGRQKQWMILLYPCFRISVIAPRLVLKYTSALKKKITKLIDGASFFWGWRHQWTSKVCNFCCCCGRDPSSPHCTRLSPLYRPHCADTSCPEFWVPEHTQSFFHFSHIQSLASGSVNGCSLHALSPFIWISS